MGALAPEGVTGSRVLMSAEFLFLPEEMKDHFDFNLLKKIYCKWNPFFQMLCLRRPRMDSTIRDPSGASEGF